MSAVLLGTLGLLATVGVVAVAYLAAIAVADRLGESPGDLAGGFAHTLVPIALGYVVAHYFSLLLFGGQQAIVLLSDPLGTGANLLGAAERGVDYGLISGAAIALIQVAGVVVGHILGVVTAHDRAVKLFPRWEAVIGQMPLLVLMVGYTIGGLTLLFAG